MDITLCLATCIEKSLSCVSISGQSTSFSLAGQAAVWSKVEKLTGDMNKNGDEQKVMLLRQAADQGDARAQRLLALRYWRGRGMEQDLELAAKWMQRAAAQGLSLAQRDLAGLRGRVGLLWAYLSRCCNHIGDCSILISLIPTGPWNCSGSRPPGEILSRKNI